jgi:hypothetical protein
MGALAQDQNLGPKIYGGHYDLKILLSESGIYIYLLIGQDFNMSHLCGML